MVSLQLTVVWLKFPMKTRVCEGTSTCLLKIASMFFLSRQSIADTQCHVAHTCLFFSPYPSMLGRACPLSVLCTPAVLPHKEKLPCLPLPSCASKSLHLVIAALVGESCHHFCNITQISSSPCLSSRLHAFAYKLLRETSQVLIPLKVSEASPWRCLAGTSLPICRSVRWLHLCLLFIMCSLSLAPSKALC